MLKSLTRYIKTPSGILEFLAIALAFGSFITGYLSFKSLLTSSLVDFLAFSFFLLVKLLFFTSYDRKVFGWDLTRLAVYKVELAVGTFLYIYILLIAQYGGINYLFHENASLVSMIPLSIAFVLINVWNFVGFIRMSAGMRLNAVYILPIVRTLPVVFILCMGALFTFFNVVIPTIIMVIGFLVARYCFVALQRRLERHRSFQSNAAQRPL